jgi:hypothetical protein
VPFQHRSPLAENSSQRLNTLVKSLLLRRTKEQKDPLTGNPIVSQQPLLPFL